MKLTNKDSIPLFILILCLLLAFSNPVIRENDVLRVGWAIIVLMIAVNYVTGLIILKAIRSLEDKLK